MFLISSLFTGDAFGHGGSNVDRAPQIDFEKRKVTVITKMSPPDMTVGDFSNAFLEVKFVDVFENKYDKRVDGMNCFDWDFDGIFDCRYDVPIKQVTYRVEIEKQGKLLARHMFYAENGILTIDVRPDDKCSVDENDEPWQCTEIKGTKHPIIEEALYAFGENNPTIEGSVFTKGGLYNIKVEVLGAESPRSNFNEPLVFDLYVSIAQEQTFWIEYKN